MDVLLFQALTNIVGDDTVIGIVEFIGIIPVVYQIGRDLHRQGGIHTIGHRTQHQLHLIQANGLLHHGVVTQLVIGIHIDLQAVQIFHQAVGELVSHDVIVGAFRASVAKLPNTAGNRAGAIASVGGC